MWTRSWMHGWPEGCPISLTGMDELSMHGPLWCDGPQQKGCSCEQSWSWTREVKKMMTVTMHAPLTLLPACMDVMWCDVLPCYWHSWVSQRTSSPGEVLSLRRWKKCWDIWKSILRLQKKLSLRSFTGNLSLGIEQFRVMISKELLISQWKNQYETHCGWKQRPGIHFL